jgi:FdhE protein
LASLRQHPPFDVALELDAATAAEAIAAGSPLLGRATLACDPAEIRSELHRLARNLSETSAAGTPAQESASRLVNAPLDLAPVLQAALDGDRATIESAAFASNVDPAAFAQLLELALQPVLWEAAGRIAALVDLDRWNRGFCPVCGAWPALAELVGSERRRVLRCGRCGTGWSWILLLCPYCGNDDHRTLGTLHEAADDQPSALGSPEPAAAPAARVDTCERCHGYLKAITAFASYPTVRLAAEDVATLHLDVAAQGAGYRRPGDVNVATAGIPRLVREARPSPDS